MRSPNEIVPAITRKSIENIQQLLQSQFTYTDRIVSPFSLCSECLGPPHTTLLLLSGEDLVTIRNK